jgi:hypothetical protein
VGDGGDVRATGARAAAGEVPDPWARRASRVAWSLWALGLVLRVASIWVLWRATDVAPLVFGVGMPTLLAATAMGIGTSTVGAVIVSREPRHPVGWLTVAAGVMQATLGFATWYAATTWPTDPSGPAAAAALSGSALQASALGIAALTILLFPDGRPLGPRWRLLVPVTVAAMALRFFDALLGPEYVYLLPTVPNPFHLGGDLGTALEASWRSGLGFVLLFICLAAASVSTLIRYRRADDVLRHQIAWFAYAGVFVVLGSVPFAWYVIVAGPTTTEGAWSATLFFLVLTLPSVAVGIAILRYRLYEIDRIVNRTVLYVGLSAILAGVVAAAITLTQRGFVALTGETSDIAWVFTALVATATYTPVRKWLEAIVDRRLRYAPPYHAFRGELVEVLGVLAPERAARRLAEDAVADLGAAGAEVRVDRGSGDPVVVAAGAWSDGAEVLELPIESEGRRVGSLRVAARPDGRPYDDETIAAARETVALVGEALGPRVRPRAGQPPASTR